MADEAASGCPEERLKCLNPGCAGVLSEGYIATSVSPEIVPQGYDILLVGFRRCHGCGLLHSSSGKGLVAKDGLPLVMDEDQLSELLARGARP